MGLVPAGLLLAAATTGRSLAIIMAVGMLLLFAILATLVWTRFGQARPMTKCVFLSLLAHLLLIIYAYSTHILFGPPGKWYGQEVTIRLMDAADDQEAALVASSNPKPWEQAGQADAPIFDAPPEQTPKAIVDSSPKPETPSPVPKPEQPPAEPTQVPAKPTETPREIAAAPPSEKPPAATPEEPAAPPADSPRLTNLLPDHDPPTEKTVAADPPVAADKPPAESGSSSPPESLASEPMAPAPQTPLPASPQFVATAIPQVPRRLGDGREVPEPLQARVAADRLKAAQPFGATPQTETAVASALDWLASIQCADGRWDADAHGGGRETRTVLGHDRRGAGAQADTGVTGLALLAFLGSGETHLDGKHRETVQHGLEFLLASQAASGSLAGNAEFFAAMYCHGIAMLSLSEAYALSGDERLLPGLKAALTYTIQSQHAAGGWRYQPHDEGDMSQFGWQLMALKSADLGGIEMPAATRDKMVRFLSSCSSGKSRGLASYRPRDRVTRPMTAEAMVCRFFLDAENSPAALDEAAAYVLEERPGSGTMNYYYWYYGTLAMFQRQGDDWPRWNAALQHELLRRQRWDGSAIGSWDPDDLWGGYGGRVYSSALATLSLEVYYRYLPVHGKGAANSRLTDRPWQPAMPR